MLGARIRAGSLRAAARELARNKLDLVGAQEIRWDKGGTVRAENYKFFSMEDETKINNLNRSFCTTQNIIGSYGSRIC
jgi:hypothetical protein